MLSSRFLLLHNYVCLVADIPGLIPGAHENKGLGHAFLRHIERCKALLFVVDVACDDPLPTSQLKSLQFELNMYKPELSGRVHLVLANKMDLVPACEGEREVERLREVCGLPVAPVSALKMTSSLSDQGVCTWWNKRQLNNTLFRIATQTQTQDNNKYSL